MTRRFSLPILSLTKLITVPTWIWSLQFQWKNPRKRRKKKHLDQLQRKNMISRQPWMKPRQHSNIQMATSLSPKSSMMITPRFEIDQLDGLCLCTSHRREKHQVRPLSTRNALGILNVQSKDVPFINGHKFQPNASRMLSLERQNKIDASIITALWSMWVVQQLSKWFQQQLSSPFIIKEHTITRSRILIDRIYPHWKSSTSSYA